MNTSFAGEMKLCKLTLYSSGVGYAGDALIKFISQAEQAQKDAQAVFFDYINNIYFE